MEKEHFGFDQGLIRYLQKDEKTIPTGSFVIIPQKGDHYWFFIGREGQIGRLIENLNTKFHTD